MANYIEGEHPMVIENIDSPEPTEGHALASWDSYMVTCTCSEALNWPSVRIDRTTAEATKIIDKHAENA